MQFKSNIIQNIFYTLLVSTIFTACQKEFSESFQTYTGSNNPVDTTWAAYTKKINPVNILGNQLQPPPYIDSIDANQGGTIKFGDSLSISFPSNAFATTSLGSTGKIKIEINYLKQLGDYIRFARPSTSNQYLLQSADAFNVVATKNGQSINLANNAYCKIRYTAANNTSNVKFFTEQNFINTTDSISSWFVDAQNGLVAPWQKLDTLPNGNIIITKGYDITSFKLKWMGAQTFVDSAISTTTRINICLPLHFTNKNTSAYVVVKAKNCVAHLWPDASGRVFYADKVPLNSNITLVTISKIGNDYYLGTKNLTASNTTLISLTPELKTLSQINTYLSSL